MFRLPIFSFFLFLQNVFFFFSDSLMAVDLWFETFHCCLFSYVYSYLKLNVLRLSCFCMLLFSCNFPTDGLGWIYVTLRREIKTYESHSIYTKLKWKIIFEYLFFSFPFGVLYSLISGAAIISYKLPVFQYSTSYMFPFDVNYFLLRHSFL